jgi:integrase
MAGEISDAPNSGSVADRSCAKLGFVHFALLRDARFVDLIRAASFITPAGARTGFARARIKPAISFHILRHTWASLAVMNGTPLLVVAKNLGHADTRMVERHHGHLAPSFIADAIRAGAPRYRVKDDKRVVPLR